MQQLFKSFRSSERGAVTVDFVVLTAAIIGVLFGSFTVFGDATMDHSNRTGQAMVDHPVGWGR